MPDKVITMPKPNEKQALAFREKHRYVAYGGARGGGKSWFVRWKAVLLCLNYPGIKILITRKTFRELLLQGKVIIEESPLLMWCLANAIEIQNNYGDIKLSKKHKDDTERIDPLAAVMNALARALVRRQSNTLADALGSGEFTL